MRQPGVEVVELGVVVLSHAAWEKPDGSNPEAFAVRASRTELDGGEMDFCLHIWLRRLFQQRCESRLLEMVIARECFRHSMLLHDNKRNTIR